MRIRKAAIKILGGLALAVSGLSFQSCHTPKDVTYFQDTHHGGQIEMANPVDITVQPDDRLSILVSSKDPMLASLFNIYMPQQRSATPGVTLSNSRGGANEVASYVVDAYGDIQFPVLGTVHLGGMRRQEVAEYIKNELIRQNLVKDPTVVVDFLNHSVLVMGDVTKPGRVTFDRDRYTVLDALADAGDLTINGKRTDVKVMRNENGRQKVYELDLTKGDQVMSSPVFYLQQNDVIYVAPNDVKKRNTTANGNAPLTPSFWISVASFLTTVLVLIIK